MILDKLPKKDFKLS